MFGCSGWQVTLCDPIKNDVTSGSGERSVCVTELHHSSDIFCVWEPVPLFMEVVRPAQNLAPTDSPPPLCGFMYAMIILRTLARDYEDERARH